ncbi:MULTISPECIES: hypothetical protein [Caproicibacterium]|uniref:Uncharacterized protein n=1 Tax=Caproicibacterium argilliputei TaxID=3030016 RepID=A0AA97DA15_9FIRM|nr:hypothetical protein [Caproicibacterium argilliputei]WOC32397.1 hypothetical protein PXC00_00590 [Caproicibacterium argilliputei]
MKKCKKRFVIPVAIVAAVLIAGMAVYFHGPGVDAEKGPFITEAQAKEIAQQAVSTSADGTWTKNSKVTFLLPEHDLAGNIVMYNCRVETDGKPTGDISVMTQNGGSQGSSNNGSTLAYCDRKLQTAAKRNAQADDYLVNGAQCGYDVALKNEDGSYTVAEMNGKPKTISSRRFLWHAWFYKHCRISGWA